MLEKGEVTQDQLDQTLEKPGKTAESKVNLVIRRLEAKYNAEEREKKENQHIYMKRKLAKKYGELQEMNMEQLKQYMQAYDKFMTRRGMGKAKALKVTPSVSGGEIMSSMKSMNKLKALESSKKNLNLEGLYGMESQRSSFLDKQLSAIKTEAVDDDQDKLNNYSSVQFVNFSGRLSRS